MSETSEAMAAYKDWTAPLAMVAAESAVDTRRAMEERAEAVLTTLKGLTSGLTSGIAKTAGAYSKLVADWGRWRDLAQHREQQLEQQAATLRELQQAASITSTKLEAAMASEALAVRQRNEAALKAEQLTYKMRSMQTTLTEVCNSRQELEDALRACNPTSHLLEPAAAPL
jgi:chromosome segregation ATPase